VPVLDGISAVRILRQREKTGEINRRYVSPPLERIPSIYRLAYSLLFTTQPCIAVTGNARQAQQDECLQVCIKAFPALNI